MWPNRTVYSWPNRTINNWPSTQEKVTGIFLYLLPFLLRFYLSPATKTQRKASFGTLLDPLQIESLVVTTCKT